nr:hypothetical protein [Tanacetum cinerariifolium]
MLYVDTLIVTGSTCLGLRMMSRLSLKNDEDDSFTNFKTEYPAIVFDDTSDAALSCEPMIWHLYHLGIRYSWLRYQVERYVVDIVHSYEQRLETIWGRSVNRVHVLDFAGLADGAPEKVTGVDLFYLRSIDQETANVPHLLACDQGLRGLSMVTRELPLLDLHELGILNIYERIGDTWAWVASRPERQPDAAAGAPGAAEDAPAVDKGAQADLAPVQAPQPPPPTPKTMQQRISKLEEEVQELRRSIVGLRGYKPIN